MIKFFRKIRQKMLTENKFSKYLIYAIGEIVLVMIGILLALQVNNWNEQRKEQEQLKDLAKVLISDIKGKIKENKNDRELGNRTLFEADTLITVWEKTNKIDTIYLKNVLLMMGADFGFTSGISPVNKALSTSDLWKKLPDTLIFKIDEFYKGSIEATKVSFQNFSKYAYEHKINFLMTNDLINLNRPATEILKLLDGKEEIFIRKLRLTKDGMDRLNDRFSGVIDNGKKTIKTLEEYIQMQEN